MNWFALLFVLLLTACSSADREPINSTPTQVFLDDNPNAIFLYHSESIPNGNSILFGNNTLPYILNWAIVDVRTDMLNQSQIIVNLFDGDLTVRETRRNLCDEPPCVPGTYFWGGRFAGSQESQGYDLWFNVLDGKVKMQARISDLHYGLEYNEQLASHVLILTDTSKFPTLGFK